MSTSDEASEDYRYRELGNTMAVVRGRSIEALGLDGRTFNMLNRFARNNDVSAPMTIGCLLAGSQWNLLAIDGFDTERLEDVMSRISVYGLMLKDDLVDDWPNVAEQ